MAWRSAVGCARVTFLRSQTSFLSLQRVPKFINSRITLANFRCRHSFLDNSSLVLARNFASSSAPQEPLRPGNDEKSTKQGLIQRFKQMYRDYWYVLVPVHLVTSAFWMGGFYYLVRSGVDIVGAMEWIGVSESFTDKLRDSKAGYFALAYGCYKVATPLRYTVTIGGTTLSIKWLTELGWIKPVPSTERLREIYQEKKDGFHDAYEEKKQEFKHKTEQMKERHSRVMEDIKRYKQEMRDLKKNEVKK